MQQGADIKLAEQISKLSYDLLHVGFYPPELADTFEEITKMFNAVSGPFAILEREGRDLTDFYANCFTDVRMAICATWYNLQTFEDLCRKLEVGIEELTKAQAISPQLRMNAGGQSQKLCFEYEHFMFHQKATVDRIAFYLSGFFTKQSRQDDIFKMRDSALRTHSNRLDDPKQIYALAIDSVVNKHQSFLGSIHSSTAGRGQTERDILSHKRFIPFVNAYVEITPPGKVSVIFQATLNGRSIEPEDARTILLQRHNRIVEFTRDMLSAFFYAK